MVDSASAATPEVDANNEVDADAESEHSAEYVGPGVHQDEDADDEKNSEHDEPQIPLSEIYQKRTFIYELATSPYYFASAFFMFGVIVQSVVPFFNWHFIWFLFMQCVFLSVFTVCGICVGLALPLYNEAFIHVTNMFGIILGHRNKQMRVIEQL